MVKRYFLYLALTLLPLLTPLPLWANLEATVDRTRIESDETFVLTLTTDKTKMFSSPDIQPLEQDFVILGRNQSSQTSIINGQSSSSTRWNYTLAPRREGTLTIPAIRLGKEVSQPISIEVFPSGASAGTVPGSPGITVRIRCRCGRNQARPTRVERRANRRVRSTAIRGYSALVAHCLAEWARWV